LNLAVIMPALVIAAVLTLRGSMAARLVWTGTLVYLVYNFLYYAFAVHFNSMFLAYCGVLGFSFYALAGGVVTLPIAEVALRYGPRTPVKTTAIALLLMGLGTIFHWLNEVVTAMLARQAPQAMQESEPVAVLDLAFLAPATVAIAILLFRRNSLGFVFGPVLLGFLVLSGVGLAAMGTVMAMRGFGPGYGLFAIALGIAAGSAVLLALSLRAGQKPRAC